MGAAGAAARLVAVGARRVRRGRGAADRRLAARRRIAAGDAARRAALREAGVARIVMVTGDRAAAAETIGAALDLDAVLADRVPSDKVDAVRTEQRLHPTVMVGDGINDAPALAAANVGIAMGARGASASSRSRRRGDPRRPPRSGLLMRSSSRSARARIAMESIVAGMAPVRPGDAGRGDRLAYAGAGGIVQEVIDVAVILNALARAEPGASSAVDDTCRVGRQRCIRIMKRSKPQLDRLRDRRRAWMTRRRGGRGADRRSQRLVGQRDRRA